MNHKIAIILSSLVLYTTTTTAAIQTLPHKCPGVKAIQAAVGLFKVKEWKRGCKAWYAYQNNNFDTSAEWTFMIVEARAANADEAYKKLTATFSSLRLIEHSVAVDGSFVECKYKLAGGLYAGAISPPE